MRGVCKREKQAHGDGVHAAPLDKACDSRKLRARWSQDGAPLRAHPLAQTESPLARHQCSWPLDKKVVELWPGLPANLDHILKTSRCYQRNSPTAPFEQCVSAHRGAAGQLKRGVRYLGVGPDFCQGFRDGARGIFRSREDFENAQLAAASENAIGERSAGIDR